LVEPKLDVQKTDIKYPGGVTAVCQKRHSDPPELPKDGAWKPVELFDKKGGNKVQSEGAE
jgi:hypothetical protein